jgi:hypothetical protein
VLEHGPGVLGLVVEERALLSEVDQAAAALRPDQDGRLVCLPPVSRLVPPRAQPLDRRIRRVVVAGRYDRPGRGDVVAPVVGRGTIGVVEEELADRDDLLGCPQLICVDLPQEALLADVREWR